VDLPLRPPPDFRPALFDGLLDAVVLRRRPASPDRLFVARFFSAMTYR
jgi:hypothetical protein